MFAAVAPLAAQQDTIRPPADTGRAAPLAPAAPDTLPYYLPVSRADVPPGPFPAGTRYVFDTDSLVFTGAQTLSDLLLRIPGVYVARGGAYGAPEPVFFGGRGSQGLEVYWDGVPYLPLGRDSVFLDPARIALAPLERVEVVVLPAAVRVYLATLRVSSTIPATDIVIGRGDADAARYLGTFARRWRSGLGLALKADLRAIDGFTGTPTTKYRGSDLWARVEYLPSPRLGASYALLSSSWDRESGPGVSARDLTRTDRELRAFYRTREDGLGLLIQGIAATSRVTRDTAVAPDSGDYVLLASRAVHQTILEAQHTWRRASARARATWGYNRVPFQLEVAGGWMPWGPFTLAADARRTRYEDGATGLRAHAGAGVALPLGFSVRGDAAFGDERAAPARIGDTLQTTNDYAWAVRWERSFITLEGGAGRRGASTPAGVPADLDPVRGLGPTPQTDYVRAYAALRPLPGLVLSGWYADPVGGGGDLEPPRHARYAATFHSKFWRRFRSGAFALRAEVAAESWSRGLGGLDSSGSQLTLPGATFVEALLDIQLGSFTLYWVLRNVNLMDEGYLPGREYPKSMQYYGARWSFSN